MSKSCCEKLIIDYEPSREGKAKILLGIDGEHITRLCYCTYIVRVSTCSTHKPHHSIKLLSCWLVNSLQLPLLWSSS